MTFKEYRYLVKSDLYRYHEKMSKKSILIQLFIGEGFKYSFWMRTCQYTYSNRLFKYLVYPFSRFMLRRYRYRFNFSIPFQTNVGSGFLLAHFGNIVVNPRAVIGKNCNINHGVSIGRNSRGSKIGAPVIGDNVYIGPGAKLIGGISIGNNVAIGANCVVTKDVPNNAVVVGIPGRIISEKGSFGYINRTDYKTKLKYLKTEK